MRKASNDLHPWEALFSPHILKRGWDYYQDGAVTELLTDDHVHYTANVRGGRDYHVAIETDGISPAWMSCDCPYAGGENNCKHMAAVLYAIEKACSKSEVMIMARKASEMNETIDSVISRIPVSELRSILAEICGEDESVNRRIMLRYSDSIGPSVLKKIHFDLEHICHMYSGRNGFIDWKNAGPFEHAVNGFLSDNVEALLDRGYPLLAFQMVNDTLLRVGKQDIDDDGQLSSIAYTGYGCWEKIISTSTAEQKEEAFEWFSEHFEDRAVPDYLRDPIRQFYETEFQEPVFLKKKLQLCQITGPAPSRNNYFEYYRYEKKVSYIFRLMDALSYPEEEIQKQTERFYELPFVRRFAAERAMKHGNTEKAVDILLKNKDLDRDAPGLVSQYSSMLIRIYEQEGRTDEYRQELLYYVFNCRQTDLEYVWRLKDICTEHEWNEYRGKILDAPSCKWISLALLAEEKLLGELMRRIIDTGRIDYLDTYEKLLKADYPKKVRDAYADYIRRTMNTASGRDHYAGLIRYLKKLRDYPNGRQFTKQIADEWRTAFPRRRAMLEELSKAGF